MALGYEGYLKIDDIIIPCTGASANRNRSRIESQGLYYGSLKTKFDEKPGIFGPKLYDWNTYDMNTGFEFSKARIVLLKSMLESDNRKNSHAFCCHSPILLHNSTIEIPPNAFPLLQNTSRPSPL